MFKKIVSTLTALLFSAGMSLAAYNLSFDRLTPSNNSVPVASACGSATPDAGSSDTAGTITTATVTTCTLTFGTPYAAIPSCMVQDLTGVRASMATAVTTTAIAVTGITIADKLVWQCMAKAGG